MSRPDFDHTEDARAGLESLRWKADSVVVNHFGEKVWLKQMPGYITECCDYDAPCERHATEGPDARPQDASNSSRSGGCGD